jgi:hypothetical protein
MATEAGIPGGESVFCCVESTRLQQPTPARGRQRGGGVRARIGRGSRRGTRSITERSGTTEEILLTESAHTAVEPGHTKEYDNMGPPGIQS